VIEELVVPAFRELGLLPGDEPGDAPARVEEPDGTPSVFGYFPHRRVIHVNAERIDDGRSLLLLRCPVGVFAEGAPVHALIVGHFINHTPFHVCADDRLGFLGEMHMACDLAVRADDHALVRLRLGQMLQLAHDLDWFFPLRLPVRLHFADLARMELPWDELPHGDLGGFLDAGMASPPRERTPWTLCCLAQGLGRWPDLLRLLREHPEELPARELAPYKALAHRQLGRWLPCLKAAKVGGLRKGRYPQAPWLSPTCLHALIEAGEDIEALRLLGKSAEGYPGFHDWLRGLALHKAGDREAARKAFARYFSRWPGDVIGMTATRRLTDD
jgi:hypothetical protein